MTDWSEVLPLDRPDRRVSDGNAVRLLTDDARVVQRLWEIVDGAKERVWMSMYLLAADEIGLGTLDRLTEAARRGCEVYVVYDALASIELRGRHLAPLRAAGGRAEPFNPPWPPWRSAAPFSVRNHRKLLVVDHGAVFCGGMNLGLDYVGQEFGTLRFDDTIATAEGPCIREVGATFMRTWHALTGEMLTGSFETSPRPGGIRAEVLESDPRHPNTNLRAVIEDALSRCTERCRLVTPYFIPAPWLVDVLGAAAGRGADVQILTAGTSDSALARGAGRARYGPLLHSGVRIFEHFGRILHTKAVSIDGRFATIGSFNLDEWTARHVLDMNLAVLSPEVATALEEEFDRHLRSASEFTLARFEKRGWPTRLLQLGADLLASRI